MVDVNENLYAPYFTNFAVRGSVKENSRAGTSVLTVSAKDDDKGRDGMLRYSVKGGNGLGTFTIDEDTGVITLTRENACLPCNMSFHIGNLYVFTQISRLTTVALPVIHTEFKQSSLLSEEKLTWELHTGRSLL